MNNRKTQVVSVRLDRWMVDAIDSLTSTFDTRTDYIKRLVEADLRRQGLTPAAMRSRKELEDNG